MAGNKIDSAFQHHAHGFQRRETDRAGAAGLKDPSGRLGADAWNSQQCLVVRPVFPKQKDIKKQPMFTCLQTKEYCY